MLVRDTSGVLMVLALLVLLASQIPTTPASGEDNGSISGAASSGGVLIPRGTLNLFSETPDQSLAPSETPRPTFDVTHATLPPWCANKTCTVFVTPSPSPKPTAKPTAPPAATPTPAMVAVPAYSGLTGSQYEAALTAVGLVPAYDLVANDPNATVTAVSPAEGTLVPVGSTVTITTAPIATPKPPPTPTPDVTAPAPPTITSGPADEDTNVSFSFTGEAGATFDCRLDSGSFASCTSGVSYAVGVGNHTFEVTATDGAGNTSGASSWNWTVSPPATP